MPFKTHKRLVVLAVLSIIMGLVVGCASTPRSEPRQGGASESSEFQSVLEAARSTDAADAHEYERIDHDYRSRNFENAVKRARAFAKAYPRSQFLEHVYNLSGLSHIGLKQYQAAVSQFTKALSIAQSEVLRNMASYNLAYAYFESGQIEQSERALNALNPSSLEKSDRVKFYVLRAKSSRLKQDYAGAAQDMLAALKNLASPSPGSPTSKPMLTFLDEVLEPVGNIIVIERMLHDFEDSPGADRLLYKAGSYYFSNGDRDRAKSYFDRLMSSYPDSPYYGNARDSIHKIEFQSVVDPKKVGVVLTLSGKFGKFGYKTLQGLELAFKIFQPARTVPNPATLVVMDDQGDPDRALAAMEELYFKYHVTAIIGPLVSKLAEPMGKKAQDLGIPLITLTQKEFQGSDFVFNAALTPNMQVRELVRYATERAGIKRFAILSPAGKFGEEYSKAFWDEMDRANGMVRGSETYPNDTTDFREYIDKLVGLGQTDARAYEVEELRLLKEATPMKSHSKKFDRMFSLRPIVDFEAVFLPDEPKTLGQILPTFAYRDVEKVLFLGINTWNSQELIARAGQFAEGSVFVDGFYSGSQKPSSRRFIEEYQQIFGSDPTILEAMAYDAGRIMVSIVGNGSVRSRAEVKDRIMSMKDFPGVTGRISYQGGRLTKHLTFLTVKNGKIEEIAFQ